MIRTIALHLATDERCAARRAAALKLARLHEAAILGVCPVAPPIAMVYGGEAPVALELVEASRREAVAAAEELRRDLLADAAAQGVDADCVIAEGDPTSLLVRHAGATDLLVLSQESEGGSAISVDDVVLSSPAPALLIPYAGAFEEFGRRPLVAWNGSREAARAMRDALPFLARAEETTLVAASLPPERQPDLQRALAYLERHGVKAGARSLEGADIDVGDVLLNAISDLEGDLLVMGAYGHSRFRELILGGATRRVLRSMTAPVLMSR